MNMNIGRLTDPWGCYYEGYCELLERVRQDLPVDGRRVNRNILFPMLFIFRHILELGFKDILAHVGRIPGEHQVLFDHDLQVLRKRAEKELNGLAEFWNEEMRDCWRQICMSSEFFEKHDPDSYAFRYPATKKRLASLPSDLPIDFDDVLDSFHAARRAFIRITPKLMINDRNDLLYFDE